MCIELLLTFVFVTIILMVTIDNKTKSNFAPVYIGIALCVCIFASLVEFSCPLIIYFSFMYRNMLTGGSLNPARSLGPAIFANVWSHHYIYWIGPMAGATIAGGFYRY